MANWRDDKVLELANQLSYSNAERRYEQLEAAVELVGDVEGDKSYPWDFVHFRVTGFKPVGHCEHAILGKVLRADLATLIEFLSDTLSIKVGEAGGWSGKKGRGAGGAMGEGGGGEGGDEAGVLAICVLSMEEVSKKFGVSSKTIQRWRKEGLIGLKYVYEDGRRRLGFLESAVGRFAAANKERLAKSATFKQLSEEEKRRIVGMARELAGVDGATMSEVAGKIAERVGRSVEAVREAIKKYDAEHPESAVFGEEGDLARGGGGERAGIVELFEEGVPLDRIAERFARTKAAVFRIVTEARAAKMKGERVEYVGNPLFEHPEAEGIVMTVLPGEALERARATVAAGANKRLGDVYLARVPGGLPGFLRDIFEQPVMPAELETDAFRRMNYLKWKAGRMLAGMSAAEVKEGELEAIQGVLKTVQAALSLAHEIKNSIVENNLRVAVHVARKHQRADRALVELFSDATIWLMRAVETFDFARGTRFTTYASYAIMKNFARDRAEQLTRRDLRVLTGQEELLGEVKAHDVEAVGDVLDAKELEGELGVAMEELPARERELLARHYGLGEEKGGESLSEIGDKMGITKARVRQLEARALVRLRGLLEKRREKLHDATMKG